MISAFLFSRCSWLMQAMIYCSTSHTSQRLVSFVNWFKNITHKEYQRFIEADITGFHLSVLKQHLSRATSYAKIMITIEGKVIDAIKLARKWLLFSKEGSWVKRGENPSLM